MTKRKKAADLEPETEATVEIGGRSYRLHGDEPQLWKRLAEGIDREMREIAGPKGEIDDFRVAVLAALNLSADHEEDRREWIGRARRLRARARTLSDRIEELASQARSGAGAAG